MNIKSAAAAFVIALTCGSAALAQGDAQKKELAQRIVSLQQGPEMDQLSAQLASQAIGPMLAKWGPRLQSDVPEPRRKEVTDRLNEELNKFRNDTFAIIRGKAGQISSDNLVPFYVERFSEEELRQLVAFFDSPVVKKYQAALPEMLRTLVQQLFEATKGEVQTRIAAFDAEAAKLIGAESAKKNAAPAKKK